MVHVQPNAKVYFFDVMPTPVCETPTYRVYKTRPLQTGCHYYYDVRAEVDESGNVLTESQKITICAGNTTEVHFKNLQSSDSLPGPKELPKLPEAFFPTVEP